MMRIPKRPSVGWMMDYAAYHLKRGRRVLCWYWLIKAARLAWPGPMCIIVGEDDETRDMRWMYEQSGEYQLEQNEDDRPW